MDQPAAALPPVLLLHGFTQTAASWRPIVELLPASVRVRAPDAPGHGSASDLRLDLAGAAARLANEIGDEPAVVVGYSMGGRTALRLALDQPARVAGLVLVGATAGIVDPDERAQRRAADEELAKRIERDGVDAFLVRWLAQPLFDGLVSEPDDLAARHANTASGLASSLRLSGTGTMDPPWWGELASIACPVLVAWGDQDHKFAGLGARLVEAIGPNARAAPVEHAGHAAHLEQPEAFTTLLTDFLADVAGGSVSRG